MNKQMNFLLLATLILSTFSSCGRNHYEYFTTVGTPGAPGVNAHPCVVTTVAPGPAAPNGGQLISCPTSTGLVLNGTNGTNGTLLTPVQFCPGTTVYPSKFIEVGFKIGTKLYAVYSINNGALTEIPPGYYSSNVVNSSCNFTVNADLTITN